MQFPPLPPTSQSWADKILWMLGGGTILSAILGTVKLIFYRNKPRSEIASLDAGTSETQANTVIRLSKRLVELHDRIDIMEQGIDRHQRETADTIQFYRTQIDILELKAKYADKLDSAYRNRSHELNGELGRLVLALTNLQIAYLEKTGEKPIIVQIRTYDEIVSPYPLPDPPE